MPYVNHKNADIRSLGGPKYANWSFISNNEDQESTATDVYLQAQTRQGPMKVIT